MSVRPMIVTLHVFPVESGVRVDVVAANPPSGASPAFDAMLSAVSGLAAAVLTDPGLDLLGSRSFRTEGSRVSPRQIQTLDGGSTQ